MELRRIVGSQGLTGSKMTQNSTDLRPSCCDRKNERAVVSMSGKQTGDGKNMPRYMALSDWPD